MARNKVRLSRAGVEAMLKSAGMRQAVLTKAGEVARNVTNQGLEASSPGKDLGTKLRAAVEEHVTDRQRAVVIVRHPAALAMQAKHGMLTKAAAEAGLKVRAQ